jgi:hypothetical protein
VQPAFGRREIWISLRTTRRCEAEARSHAAIAKITDQIEAKRRERRAAAEEGAFLGSGRFDAALAAHVAASRTLDGGGQPFAWRAETAEAMAAAALGVLLGQTRPRPASRAEAAAIIEHDLAELEAVRRHPASVSRSGASASRSPDVSTPSAAASPPLTMASCASMVRLSASSSSSKRAISAGT